MLVGAENTFNDLKYLDPTVYENLRFLKTYDGDASDLGLYFTHEYQKSDGRLVVKTLIPNGANIQVTNQNKMLYIQKKADFMLNKMIKIQAEAFREGIGLIIDLQYL